MNVLLPISIIFINKLVSKFQQRSLLAPLIKVFISLCVFFGLYSTGLVNINFTSISTLIFCMTSILFLLTKNESIESYGAYLFSYLIMIESLQNAGIILFFVYLVVTGKLSRLEILLFFIAFVTIYLNILSFISAEYYNNYFIAGFMYSIYILKSSRSHEEINQFSSFTVPLTLGAAFSNLSTAMTQTDLFVFLLLLVFIEVIFLSALKKHAFEEHSLLMMTLISISFESNLLLIIIVLFAIKKFIHLEIEKEIYLKEISFVQYEIMALGLIVLIPLFYMDWSALSLELTLAVLYIISKSAYEYIKCNNQNSRLLRVKIC